MSLANGHDEDDYGFATGAISRTKPGPASPAGPALPPKGPGTNGDQQDKTDTRVCKPFEQYTAQSEAGTRRRKNEPIGGHCCFFRNVVASRNVDCEGLHQQKHIACVVGRTWMQTHGFTCNAIVP